MSPKFEVYKDAAGKFRFRLRADNNKIVAVGEAYEQHVSCINGIKSIQKNSNSEIEDLIIADRKVLNPKYQVFTDAAGKFRFHLKAANGEIIAQGEGYETKDGCLNGIEVVKKSADAQIEDSSVTPKSAEAEAEITLPKSNEETAQTEPGKPSEIENSKLKNQNALEKSRIVFVGNKSPMDYVMAIITGLSANNVKEITLKARGQAITTAVDAAEVTRNRFLKNLKVSKISIGTEEMPPR